MSAFEPSYPSLSGGFFSVIRRDLLLAMRRPGDLLNPLFFFAMVCTLFPLAVGPSAEQLEFSGPGVLWVAAGVSSSEATAAVGSSSEPPQAATTRPTTSSAAAGRRRVPRGVVDLVARVGRSCIGFLSCVR